MADYYKIKLEWNDGKWDKTQKGAFTSKEQAIQQCTQDLIDQGYKVFSPTGEIVYPIYYHELAEQMFKDGVITDRQYWTNVFQDKDLVLVDNQFLQTVIERYSDKVNSTNTNTIIPDVENNTQENFDFLPDIDIQIPTVKLPSINTLKYNGVEIYRVPTSKFKLIWWDKPKRNCNKSTYFSSGYFGNFKEANGLKFTLPSGNLIADIDSSTINPIILNYLNERKIENGKLYFPANLNTNAEIRKANVSTLCINSKNQANILKLNTIYNTDYKYAVSGAPIITNGKYADNFTQEGWDTSIVRPTEHVLIGTKKDNDNFIYIIIYKTSTSNCLKSKELYNKFVGFGFNNLLKLDGGGSTFGKVNNEIVANTYENRQINSLIVIDD